MDPAAPKPSASDAGDKPAAARPRRRAFRSPAKLLDSAAAAVWIVNSAHELVYLNARASEWLGISGERLLGRRCHPAAPRESPEDAAVASIAPPLELPSGASIVTEAEPPGGPPLLVRFVRVGNEANETTFAFGGATDTSGTETGGELFRQVRQQLSRMRRHDAACGAIAAAGTSRPARRLAAQLRLAAATRRDLAIIGPPGCGSETLARRIQAITPALPADATADPIGFEPVIVIDTPLMDAELLEATLAPAEVHLRSRGAVATLILRAVDESPHLVQQRLINFAGSYPSAVRIIALACVSPGAPRGGELFTPDMADLLSVFELVIEPLAERTEDIPLIATALLEHRHAAGKTTARGFSREVLDQFVIYPWPNNFDELEAAVRHAAGACRGKVIGIDHLPLAIRSFRLNAPPARPASVPENLDDAIRDFEVGKIRDALEITAGNRSEAARLLGISRARLIRRLADHGIDVGESAAEPPADEGK